jgi:hypothetical protein
VGSSNVVSNSDNTLIRKDYTEEDLRYLKTVINSKIIKNNYPFIIKFEFFGDFDKYVTIIPIDMVIDLEKYSEFLGLPIDEYFYKKYKKNEPLYFNSMSGPINIDNDWDKNIRDVVNLKNKMDGELNDLYTIITPKENRIRYVEIVEPDYEFVSSITIMGIRC